jgi:quercetin dioxygenase-like cupin family protein
MLLRFGSSPVAILIVLLLSACESEPVEDTTTEAADTLTAAALPPEPTVTYTTPAEPGVRIEHGEVIADIDDARRALHAQHHPDTPIENRTLPGPFEVPDMTSIEDFALLKDDLVVINPGPGEFVHVMEGQRHGYRNLTIGITYTAPGGAPPMHTHEGEEAHVLLQGKILYALGDEIFTIEGPYILNIPPMVPHSFMNLGDGLAELVVIFPTNVWEYDVLDTFPFRNVDVEAMRQAPTRQPLSRE